MQDLILASQSEARLRLLQAAGLPFEPRPAHVDEDGLKAALRESGASVEDAALTLAEAKARKIRVADALVVAADQMLDLNGSWLDKPSDIDAARSQLSALSGYTHRLIVGAVIFENGAEIWRVVTRATLTMRQLTAPEIDDYLGAVGDAVLKSVGGYQIEGRGVRLFSRIDGDVFTIQGLPLLEISGFLHDRGYGYAYA